MAAPCRACIRSAHVPHLQLWLFRIGVFDVPANGFEHIDFSEKPLGGVEARRQREQNPVNRRVDDAHGVITNDLRIVPRVEPRSASQLQQAECIDQHSPEVRNWRASAWRVTDGIAKDPERRDADKSEGPQVRYGAFDIQRIHPPHLPVSENVPVAAKYLAQAKRPSLALMPPNVEGFRSQHPNQ